MNNYNAIITHSIYEPCNTKFLRKLYNNGPEWLSVTLNLAQLMNAFESPKRGRIFVARSNLSSVSKLMTCYMNITASDTKAIVSCGASICGVT